MKMKLADLKIDPDFRDLLPELDAETYTALEKDISANGMIDPIVIWNGFIADGHNRYSICKAHRVAEVEVKELRKTTKSEVMQWIVDHQFSKRNLLLSEKYTLLSKVREQVEKEAEARKKEGKNQYSSLSPNLDEASTKETGRTDEIMAKKLGVSRNTFRDIDTVMTKGTPDKIARMDKGGRGNSASAIAKEIKDGIPDGYRKCNKCGQVKKIEFFKKGEQEGTYKTICKECYNKQERERKTYESAAPRANYYDVNASVEWKFEDVEGEIDHLMERVLDNLKTTYEVHKTDVFASDINRGKFAIKLNEFAEKIKSLNKELKNEHTA